MDSGGRERERERERKREGVKSENGALSTVCLFTPFVLCLSLCQNNVLLHNRQEKTKLATWTRKEQEGEE